MERDVLAAREPLAQPGLEPMVELDGVYVSHPLGQIGSENAEPGPDLEHAVVGVQLGQAPDNAEQVFIDQKVLAELLLGDETRSGHGRRKAVRVLAAVRSASSATGAATSSARATSV